MRIGFVLILTLCLIRSLSFSKWCFENKKITGGISVIILSACVVLSGIVIFR